MYIQEIHIKSFRHLENVHLGPYRIPAQGSDIAVLAGTNGGGKSSVLELLGYALSTSWSLGWSLRRSFPDNAFEVALAVTPEERDLIRQHIAANEPQYSEAAQGYFDDRSVYYRSYNYNEGEYQKDAPLYNEVHNLVSQALRSQYGRSLGFFLKSDRFYPPEAFHRDRLFSYPQIQQRDYIWNMAFNTSDVQYRDMFEFLVQQRYHYFRQLGAYHHRAITNAEGGLTAPKDPLLAYDELLQRLFPGYKFADNDEEIPTNLFVKLPTGQTVQFHDLSSGEKEVFFVLSFFLRHDVSNAVIVIDEPELHLHPELSRLLVRTMQSIKAGNQIWMATHNPEIIDEAGRDRVTYLTRDPVTFKAVVTKGTDEAQAIRIMKDMFGFSGYIGIAKRMVFLEGDNASADRKVFANVFPEYGASLRFVPANSCDNQTRINAAIMAILESDLGWGEFYLIRDRDYLTQEQITKFSSHQSGRVHVLERHEIENYLLDPKLISAVHTEIYNKPKSPEQVEQRLRAVALALSGEVLRDMVSYRLNLAYGPQDFSLGNLLRGQPVLDTSGAINTQRITALQSHLQTKVTDINADMAQITTGGALLELVWGYAEEIRVALAADGDGWVRLFPGKRLLEEYARAEGLGDHIVLQNSLIKQLAVTTELVPDELRRLLAKISEGVLLA